MKTKSKFEISKDQIIAFHTLIVSSFQGMYELRSPNALDPVLELYASANTTNGSTISRVSALIYGLIRFHPFLDANKRTAIIASTTCLMMNGYMLESDDNALLSMLCDVETGALSREELREWLLERVTPIFNSSMTRS